MNRSRGSVFGVHSYLIRANGDTDPQAGNRLASRRHGRALVACTSLHPCDTARGRHGSSRDFFGSGSPHPRRLTIRDKFVELPRIVRADVAAPLRTRRTHHGREARTAALVRKLPRVRGRLGCLLRPAVLGRRPFRPVRSVRSRCRPASGCLQRAVPGRHVRVGSRGFAVVCVGRRPPGTQDCTTWRSSLQPPAGLAVETTPIPPQVAAAIPHCHLPLRLFELQQLEALQKHKVGLSLHRRVHIGARHQLARRAIASECVGAHQRRARHSHASDPRDPRLRNQLCSGQGQTSSGSSIRMRRASTLLCSQRISTRIEVLD